MMTYSILVTVGSTYYSYVIMKVLKEEFFFFFFHNLVIIVIYRLITETQPFLNHGPGGKMTKELAP